MEEINKFINYSKESYNKNNYIELNFSNSSIGNIYDISLDSKKLIQLLKDFRKYKLGYAQGKIYRNGDLNCYSLFSKNLICKKETILEKSHIDYNGKNILIVNKDIKDMLDFPNLEEYNLEKDYEQFTIYINKDMKIMVENIDEVYSIKILVNIQKDIPDTYLTEYLKGIEENTEIILSGLF
jgi:hypothetical protein